VGIAEHGKSVDWRARRVDPRGTGLKGNPGGFRNGRAQVPEVAKGRPWAHGREGREPDISARGRAARSGPDGFVAHGSGK
jgi:hypothetical protein